MRVILKSLLMIVLGISCVSCSVGRMYQGPQKSHEEIAILSCADFFSLVYIESVQVSYMGKKYDKIELLPGVNTVKVIARKEVVLFFLFSLMHTYIEDLTFTAEAGHQYKAFIGVSKICIKDISTSDIVSCSKSIKPRSKLNPLLPSVRM